MSAETLTPFEERLLEGLQRHRHALPRGRRRTLRRPVVVAAALVAALAVAAAVGAATKVVVDTIWGDQPIWRTITSANYDQRRAQSALEHARNLVLHVTVRDSGERVRESWYDAGRSTVAAGLRRDLGTGVYFSFGRERIDGREVVHVVRFRDSLPRFEPSTVAVAGPLGTAELWLDAKTYLPVRKTVITSPAAGGHALTYDYEWLPRTPANVGRLRRGPAG